jgi:two-component system osmolarity sensor histidine kinase EnvZ
MPRLDTMFARTALLISASGLAFAILFLAVGRIFAGPPAIRASAMTLAELLERDPAIAAHAQAAGPPPSTWRDKVLAQTLLWRTFADVLTDRLGPRAGLEVRAHVEGAIIWVRMPPDGKWIHWQTSLPASNIRAGASALLIAIGVAITIGGVLMARQVTRPLRKLAIVADQLSAGELPGDETFTGPLEVRRVYDAFQRLCTSLQAAEREREALLAGVSHDMRTPISRVRFALELYGEGAAPRLVDELSSNLQELEQAASRFIAYARSHYDEPFSPTSVDSLVEASIEARGLARIVEFEARAPEPTFLQRDNVHALIDNLLDNAVKHGRRPIRIRTLQTGPELIVSVKDGGDGIPPARHAEVLQPFTRLAESTASGSGLGLAIVERVTKRHGGRVEMRNSSKGFEVRVTLFGRAPR